MRLLLDECLPKDLAGEFPGHKVRTVGQMGWLSAKNGQLLRLIAQADAFDVFLTVDKNLPRQHKTGNLPFAIIVLRAKSNRLPDVKPLAPVVLRRLSELKPGHVLVLSHE